MDRKVITDYIEKGLETELLDKLNSYTFSGLDNRFWNMLGILVELQEKAKIDWYQPNQALVRHIINVLPELFKDDGAGLALLFETLSKNAVPHYTNLSYLGRQFIIGIGDKDEKMINCGLKEEQFQKLIEKFWSLNLQLLKKSISNPEPDHDHITSIFYNNVDHLAEHRRTIIRTEALEEYRKYIITNPMAYMSRYIRPYWTGTTVDYIDNYYHVPEPFQTQIFSKEHSWLDFIGSAKLAKVEAALVDDLLEFQQNYTTQPIDGEDRRVILYSEEMRNLRYGMPKNMIKLQAESHTGVRKECLPPEYTLPKIQ